MFWVGATGRDSQGQFVYQHSGEQVPGAYWAHGEPNNLFKAGDEHCVKMRMIRGFFGFGDGDLEFFDQPCNERWWFICEKP